MTPRRRVRTCTTPGCGILTPGGRCPTCQAAADKARDSGTKTYGPGHRARFRPGVLAKNSGRCVHCGQPATVADHWPLDRRDLIARGLDPDDPVHGRPLCAPCHNRWTAISNPAGWNAPKA